MKSVKKTVFQLPGLHQIHEKWAKLSISVRANGRDLKKLEKEVRKLNNSIGSLEREVVAQKEITNLAHLQSYLTQMHINEGTRLIQRKIHCTEQAGVNPLVSIVIVNRDGLKNLKVLFPSLRDRVFYNNIEIIFVDNDSHDDSLPYVRSFTRDFELRIIRNDHNMSFSEANNIGAHAANGDYLLFLNNDTEVTDGWLDELLLVALRNDKIGAVGAKLVYPRVPTNSINSGKSYSIQHAGIGFRSVRRFGTFSYQPYNLFNGEIITEGPTEPVERAAVTAAVLLVARSVFDEVEGFDESYCYGYEDVDLCLKIHKAGYKNIYCPSSLVFHYEFGTQERSDKDETKSRRKHNWAVLTGKWQRYLSQCILEEKLRGVNLFSSEKLVIGIVDQNDRLSLTSNGAFVANDLASSFEKLGYEVRLFDSFSENHDWYDVGIDVDILICLNESYNVTNIRNQKDDIITVAWVWDQFERWCSHSYFNSYGIVLAACDEGRAYIVNHSDHETCLLLPLATNPDRFCITPYEMSSAKKRLHQTDCMLTSRCWPVRHEVDKCICTARPACSVGVVGDAWQAKEGDCRFTRFQSDELPYAYSLTKVLIDYSDASEGTIHALDSCVFDALVADTLVLTNNSIGFLELFNEAILTYDNWDDLTTSLEGFLADEQRRLETISTLKDKVLNYHTFDVRARTLRDVLIERNRKDELDDTRIDIFGAMPDDDTCKYWGDYYYAQSLKKEFEKRGFRVTVVPRTRWYKRSDALYVIVLRGRWEFYPSDIEGRKHVMWAISHPADITTNEMNRYDHIFFASKRFREKVAPQITRPSSVLLQCTDPDVMAHTKARKKAYELLFVGNARGAYRKILSDLLPCDFNLTIYGRGWDNTAAAKYVKETLLPNNMLAQAYADADIVLNDHWDDMREYGIVSNRIFDALAAGAQVLSDYMPEIYDLFGEAVTTYTDREDLLAKIKQLLSGNDGRKECIDAGRKNVLDQHCFCHRVEDIIQTFEVL